MLLGACMKQITVSDQRQRSGRTLECALAKAIAIRQDSSLPFISVLDQSAAAAASFIDSVSRYVTIARHYYGWWPPCSRDSAIGASFRRLGSALLGTHRSKILCRDRRSDTKAHVSSTHS